MTIGIVELALLIVLGSAAGVAWFTGKQRWLLPMVGFCLVATLFSSPDVFSTILLTLSAFAIHWFSVRRATQTH